jgi:hypothetical protein
VCPSVPCDKPCLNENVLSFKVKATVLEKWYLCSRELVSLGNTKIYPIIGVCWQSKYKQGNTPKNFYLTIYQKHKVSEKRHSSNSSD